MLRAQLRGRLEHLHRRCVQRPRSGRAAGAAADSWSASFSPQPSPLQCRACAEPGLAMGGRALAGGRRDKTLVGRARTWTHSCASNTVRPADGALRRSGLMPRFSLFCFFHADLDLRSGLFGSPQRPPHCDRGGRPPPLWLRPTARCRNGADAALLTDVVASCKENWESRKPVLRTRTVLQCTACSCI